MPKKYNSGLVSNTSNGSYGYFHSDWRPTTLGQLPKQQRNKKHDKFVEGLSKSSDEYGYYHWDKMENKFMVPEWEGDNLGWRTATEGGRKSNILNEDKGWSEKSEKKSSFLPPIRKATASFRVKTGNKNVEEFKLPDIKHIDIQLVLGDGRTMVIRANPKDTYFTSE